MQRLHQDDLTGHLLEKGGFEVLRLPAIATEVEKLQIGANHFHRRAIGEALHPGREGLATLERIKAMVGSRVFQAQYQQTPVPAEGNLFKAAWLKRYVAAPTRDTFAQIVQSWDTATKIGNANDFSACTTWIIVNNLYFLLDVCRGQWEFPDLLRAVIAQAEVHKVTTILIEDANSGMALLQSLRQQTRLNVIGIKPKLDKMARAAQQSAAFESGRVHLPEAAPWLADFESELLGFPNARHDDQVDSAVQFLQWAAEQSQFQFVWVPPIIFSRPRDFPSGRPH